MSDKEKKENYLLRQYRFECIDGMLNGDAWTGEIYEMTSAEYKEKVAMVDMDEDGNLIFPASYHEWESKRSNLNKKNNE